MTDLAEMLINMQSVRGVEACFDQVSGGQIESGFAELEAGKVLTSCGVPFRFIWPDKRGESFDIELAFRGGHLGCAEVKAKFATTVPSERTVMDALDTARGQLPKDHPGVLILKLPVRWLREPDAGKMAADGTLKYLRQTSRVVAALVIYSDDVFTNPQVHTWLHVVEVQNDRHKFDEGLDWRVLRAEPSIPADWISLRQALLSAMTG